MADFDKLKKLCQLIRYDILTSTTEAGSGHPTSSLSAVELMTTLFFGATSDVADGFYHFDLENPHNLVNDRVIFSKGHAAPLLYSLYHAAGAISYQELMRLRKFNSNLEGHPTFRFKYADIATGSLGQGLSAGVGMALGIRLTIENRKWKVGVENRKLKIEKDQSSILNPQHLSSIINRLPSIPNVFVLLGDSEMAEGQVWEAIQIASFYKLNNLIVIADINRLGQSTQTMLGWNLKTYAKRIESFGWRTIIVNDGHDLQKVYDAFEEVKSQKSKVKNPTMILAKTIKGKGGSFFENKEGWHGKPLNKEQLTVALNELGKVDLKVRGTISKPNFQFPTHEPDQRSVQGPVPNASSGTRVSNFQTNLKSPITKIKKLIQTDYRLGNQVATRQAYGNALVAIGNNNDKVVVFDAEVSNSTFSEKFAKKFPKRYFEMFIAEQNMISTALGLSKLGFIPFVSTFAAFLTRGFDQIRMAQYSAPNLKIVGSHCGVSIGPDGPSQMGLEDLAMFRSILKSTIFYPADAVSTFKLTEVMANKNGLFYLRTNRKETPVIYGEKEKFKIGGSKVHRIKISKPKALIVGAGVTLHEALRAQKELAKQGIETVVLDCYSVKPIDSQTINKLVSKIPNIIVVEDHYPAGGIGEAVLSILNPTIDDRKSKIGVENRRLKIENLSSNLNSQNLSSMLYHLPSKNFSFIHLCVHKLPRSGSPEELLRYEEIDAEAIIKAVKKF